MAPIRRYLRISQYSVLECRIYLENPNDTRWLLDDRHHQPVLPQVFDSIRPLVLPKLREANERAQAKKKSNPVKDIVVAEDYEVSVFLRETGTRHSIITRQKTFIDPSRTAKNLNTLSGADATTNDGGGDNDNGKQQHILVESDEDEEQQADLHDIPEALPLDSEGVMETSSRRRRTAGAIATGKNNRVAKRRRVANDETPKQSVPGVDDKKLGLVANYDGFAIWGWILCLLIKRKSTAGRPQRVATGSTWQIGEQERDVSLRGQDLMEEWICTQTPQEYNES